MKLQATCQEVLLLNSTGLSKRQLCPNSNDPDSKHLSPMEQLEKACWDGLLTEILPEVILRPATGCRSFVWKVFVTKKFIHVNMGPSPSTENKKTSIDPCYFYQNLLLN